jgi:hypothetical protein
MSGEISNSATGASSVVQIGVVQGDVNLRTGASVRSRYRRQVERIAPQELVGREAEPAELSSAGGYTWWRAEAWAGKSALLSTPESHPAGDARRSGGLVRGSG